MKTVNRGIREHFSRRLALLGIVASSVLAFINGERVWSALVSGQARFPLPMTAVFSRTTEPLMFHAALMTSMALALGFVALAYLCWRER